MSRRHQVLRWPGPARWVFGRQKFLRDNQSRAVAAALQAMEGRGPRLMKGRIGALLADDVGMGKTFEAIAASAIYLAAKGPGSKAVFLIPPGLMEKWTAEIRKFCRLARGGGKRMESVLHAFERAASLDAAGRIRLFPTSKARRLTRGRAASWLDRLDLLVLDEAHKARKSSTRLSQALTRIRGRRPNCPFLFLSATPFQCDSHRELIHVLSFLDRNFDPTYIPPRLNCGDNAVRPQSIVNFIAVGLSYMDDRLGRLLQTTDPKELRREFRALITQLDRNIDLPIDPAGRTFEVEIGEKAQDGLDEYLRALVIRTPKPQPARIKRKLVLTGADATLYLFGRAYLRQNAKDSPYALDPPPGGRFLPNGYSRLCSAHSALAKGAARSAKPHAHRALIAGLTRREGKKDWPYTHPKMREMIARILVVLAGGSKSNRSFGKVLVFFNHLKTIQRARHALSEHPKIRKQLLGRPLIQTKQKPSRRKCRIAESILKKGRLGLGRLQALLGPCGLRDIEVERLYKALVQGVLRFRGRDRNALVTFWRSRIEELATQAKDSNDARRLRKRIRGLLSKPEGKPSGRLLTGQLPVRQFKAVEEFSGESREERRNRVIEAFNAPGVPPFVLLASQIGAEGLDMQKACRTVIHHDLHWNPTVLDQRTGRIYRDNVKASEVRVETLEYLSGYDHVVQRYAERRAAYKDFLLGEKALGRFLEAYAEGEGAVLPARAPVTLKRSGWLIDLEPPSLARSR